MATPSANGRRQRGQSRSQADEFLQATERARELFRRLVNNGYSLKSAGKKPTRLSEPDRRDIAAYLFFEVAAKFEQFVKRTLVLEVQKTLRVNRTRAEHMIGSSADGISDSMGGWAHLSKMQERSAGILGKGAVYARAGALLKNPKAQYLSIAVTTRNRIAHGKGNDDFTTMLGKQPVNLSAKQRKGVSPGVFLIAHPKGASMNDKWFFRLLDAYDAWVRLVRQKV